MGRGICRCDCEPNGGKAEWCLECGDLLLDFRQQQRQGWAKLLALSHPSTVTSSESCQCFLIGCALLNLGGERTELGDVGITWRQRTNSQLQGLFLHDTIQLARWPINVVPRFVIIG
jgi:hypothetical protein